MNKAKRFFGRKSVRKLTEDSLSHRNEDDDFQGYSDDHPPVFSFPSPIDLREHPTLATNREGHLSQRLILNTVSLGTLTNIGFKIDILYFVYF